jgi:uncharacterized protein
LDITQWKDLASIRLLYPHPALLLEEEHTSSNRYLVISDLHIGFESGLKLRGVIVDSKCSLNTMLDELRYIIESHRIDVVILIGDVKSTIRNISKQEWNEVPEFFKILSRQVNIYLVPGNHDGLIRFLIPQNINIMSVKGMVLEETLLVHGHVMPSPARSAITRIVMGHMHPIFSKCNNVLDGRQIWLYIKVNSEMIFPGTAGTIDIIIMPSFNKEIHVIHKGYHKSIPPIIKRAIDFNGIKKAMVMAMDGSILSDDCDLAVKLLS